MANYHLDSVTISFSLLVQEISIEDSTDFLHYFLVLSLFVFFDTLEHASHKPEVKVRVLHEVHELDMLKDISFLLEKIGIRNHKVHLLFCKNRHNFVRKIHRG